MKSAKWTLLKLLKTYLLMLHPFVPFISERIWQDLARATGESATIMYEKWPQ
jgi:valyl-tRNA synthetase